MEMVINNGEELTLQYDFDKPVETAQVTGSKDFKDYIEDWLNFNDEEENE